MITRFIIWFCLQAEELFNYGLLKGVYNETYDVINPLLMQLSTDLNKRELTMSIEHHLKKVSSIWFGFI